MLLQVLSSIAGFGVLVCFIIVTVKMFQNSDVTGGVISIISLLICCLGLLFNINFILGWLKADKWNMKNLMYIYSGFFAVYILTTVISGPAQYQQMMEQIKQAQQQQQGGLPQGPVVVPPPVDDDAAAPAPAPIGNEPAPVNP